MKSDVTVRRDEATSRYLAYVDDAVAGFLVYRNRDGQRDLVHTVVEDAFEGRGVGSTLVRTALDEARADGRSGVPSCRFVQSWLRRHRAYIVLVPAEKREHFDLESTAGS